MKTILKKVGATFLTAAMAASLCTGMASAEEDLVLVGDVTGDGIINTMDAFAVYRVVNGAEAKELSVAADINGDGVLNMEDVLSVYRVS